MIEIKEVKYALGQYMQYELEGVVILTSSIGILTASIGGNVGIEMVHIEGVAMNSSVLRTIQLMVGHWG